MPSPIDTERWLLFSPDPTQITRESCGSTVTQPMECDFSPSKIGAKPVPAFVVFQTPPPAVAMYQTRASRGSTVRSTMRPEVSAGPSGRSSRPANVFSPYFDSFSFESAAGVTASAVSASARKIARMQVNRWRIDDLLWGKTLFRVAPLIRPSGTFCSEGGDGGRLFLECGGEATALKAEALPPHSKNNRTERRSALGVFDHEG